MPYPSPKICLCLPVGADTLPWYSFPISVRQKGASKSCGQASGKLVFVKYHLNGARTVQQSVHFSGVPGERVPDVVWTAVPKSSKVEEKEVFKAHCSENSCAHWSKRLLLSPTMGVLRRGRWELLGKLEHQECQPGPPPAEYNLHEWGQRPLLVLLTMSPASMRTSYNYCSVNIYGMHEWRRQKDWAPQKSFWIKRGVLEGVTSALVMLSFPRRCF